MEYKATYTKEEVDELVTWFDTHTYEQSIDLGSGISIPNVSTTVKQMSHIARTKYDNRRFSGQIFVLFRIREELIKQNKVLGEK